MVAGSEELSAHLAGARAADRAFLASVTALDDGALHAPCALPGWTRAHLVAHVARHAESHARMLRGDTDQQYPDGFEGRAADIERSRAPSVAEAIADLTRWTEALCAAWDDVDDWDEPRRYLVGTGPTRTSVYMRWREVGIHHVDLDAGFGAADWSEPFVRATWAEAVATLEPRVPEGHKLLVVGNDVGLSASAGSEGDEVEVRAPAWAIVAWCWGRIVPDGVIEATSAGDPVPVPDIGGWV